MSFLSISNLTVEYPGPLGTFTAVKNASLTVARGEILGIVGESGAGKSTIGNAIMGLLDHPGRVSGGEIIFDGERLNPADDRAMRGLRGKRISMIFQDPMTSLNPLFTVGEQLIETIRTHKRLSADEARKNAIELLASVGIASPEERIDHYPHQFSGGMRQRVVIALVLCSDPDLIIADEPTTALDVSVQAQILDLIKSLVATRNVGVILVTHDMGVIAETTDRVVMMYKGEVVETGETAQIIHAPKQAYTKSLISAVPRGDRRLDRFPGVSFLEADRPAEPKLGGWWFDNTNQMPAITDEPLVTVRNLGLRFTTRHALLPSYRRYFNAVKDVSFQIRRGEVLGLVGESGSGKSSIAKLLTQIYKPSSGEIRFGEHRLGTLTAREQKLLRSQIQMIFQDPYSSLNPRMSVERIIAEPIRHHANASGAEIAKLVHELLEIVGLGAAAAKKFPHEFSGGQRQRIAIARALATRPRFLICDEPTSALDVSIQAQILNLLKDLRDALDLTVLFISHDLPVVRQMCDRIIVMRDGQIVETSQAEHFFESPQTDYSRDLLRLMPRMPSRT
ncbi:ABC transporter ATP-binding protein [Rhizobium wenxiniae]|uniref:ABC transporter ATP-binding protein n=1 Tax=Rhizobium wenxiniae TaxID=1737357 RepID=UPI001C6E18FF|nr:ABC transporter ATP-binding protein [Rhizobium wenxiniae]MBW9089553.1 ABC transporter ATP-binding protein [Rhizobium wenxiniae]